MRKAVKEIVGIDDKATQHQVFAILRIKERAHNAADTCDSIAYKELEKQRAAEAREAEAIAQ